MKSSKLKLAILLTFVTFSLKMLTLSAQSFRGVGDLPGGEYYSYAMAISANGKVVVGFSKSSATAADPLAYAAFRWTESGGMVALGDLPGGEYNSSAYGVNADGSVIVGESSSANSTASWYEAFRWTQAGGMKGLGDLPGGNFGSSAWSVSANGSVIVGQGLSQKGYEAFRWTSSGGFVALGDLPGGTFESMATDISANGSIVVGVGTSGHNTPPHYSTEGFKWTQAGGMVALGDLAGGLFTSTADAISDDGSVIVGSSINGPGPFYQAIYWKNGSMHSIPNLPGAQSSYAIAVSGDGSVIVGNSDHGASLTKKVWIWKQSTGTKNLKNVLENDYGLNLSGWKLVIPTDLSNDGTTIVGTGTNPAGKTEGWIAKLSGSPSQQKIIIDVPNGGESWEATWPQPIVWHTQNFTGNVKIELSTNGGSSWTTIANNVPTPTANTATSYTWTVSNTPSTNCFIKISDAADGNPSDVSDAKFTITSNSSITIDVPNGGENWTAGVPMPIVWHTHIFTGNVKIELSTNGGSTWTTIANNVATPTANTATSYNWTVSNTPSTNCLVKISNTTTGNPFDVSDSKFTISGSGNNTNTGNNVQVNLSSDVTVTFDNVTVAGNTTLNQKSSGSPPPSGFTIVPSGSPVYYDINTTATFTGNVKICIKYNDAGMTPAQEQALTLQVYEVPPGSWKDITVSRDATANIICGEVNHLTDFAIMMPTGSSNTQTISLPQGWSWISFNVQPPDLSIDKVFQSVTGLQIVVNGAGQFYMPGVINNIGQISVIAGYKVYMSAASQLIVTGQPVPLSTQINLSAGWNFISYVPVSAGPVDVLFNSILPQLALVKNDEGKFFIPGVINTLGNVKPGEGYKLYMNSSAVFNYPSP